MTIISFVEGAAAARGGMGIVGVPAILRSVAIRGHHAALILAGPVNPRQKEYVVPDVPGALRRQDGAGAFGIVNFSARPTWAFAPSILWRVRQKVRAADIITLHSLYSFPVFAGYLLARWYRKPYAIWPHGVLAPFQRRVSKGRKWLYDRLVARRILNHASVLLYSAAGEREEVQDLSLQPPSVVVADGLDSGDYANLPPRGQFRTKRLAGHEGPLVAFLARLNVKKGLDLLLKSMALVLKAFPEARLAIVGPPDPPTFENQVRRWIEDTGVGSQTVVTGMVTHQEKLELLADADVFVLPSEAENFGHSVFEAMASGIPVVVSDALNYAQEIARAGAGFASRRDPPSFAARIGELLADSALRNVMGAKGKVFARGYSSEQTGETLETIFRAIIERRPLPSAAVQPPAPRTGLSIVSFVEGALRRKGGIGIVGVPLILGSTAARGHSVVALMAGPPIPGREGFTARTVAEALLRKEGLGTFGIVPFAGLGPWALSPAMLWKGNRLVKRSDFVGLHSLYSFPVLLGYLLARFHRKPYFIWLHGVLAPFQREVSARKKWVYDRILARRILRQAAVIFFTAWGERHAAPPTALRTLSAIVPTGFIAEEFAVLPPRGAFRARFLGGYQGPLVVYLGRLNAKKGLDLLAQAMARVAAETPDVRLAIIGPPDPPSFAEQVGMWIRENGVESCTVLTGSVDPAGRLEAMADADLLVMPSHAENFGFSVFEAMASGLPVVVSNTLDYAGEIARCGAGFSVPRVAEDFANAMLKLIVDAGLRQRMGVSGAQLANRYSWRNTGEKVDRVLKCLLAGQPVPADLS